MKAIGQGNTKIAKEYTLDLLMTSNDQGWEPANFLAAPAPDFFLSSSGFKFFSEAAPAPGIFFRVALAPASRGQKKRVRLMTIG